MGDKDADRGMVASGVTSAPAKLTATTSTKRKRQDPPSLTTNSDEDSNSVEMPLVQKGPPSPTSLGSRCEDEDDEGGASGASCSSISSKKMRQAKLKDVGNHHDDDEEMEAPPMSPRVRKRLDDAKENASLFGPGERECVHVSICAYPTEMTFYLSLSHTGTNGCVGSLLAGRSYSMDECVPSGPD